MERPGRDHFRLAEARTQLTASLATVEWALERTPPAWHHRPPGGVVAGFPAGDAWSVARNLAHLAVHEERLGAPLLEDFARGGDGTGLGLRTPREDQFLAEWESLAAEPIAAILARLRAARARQLAVLEAITEERFNAPATAFFARGFGRERHSAGWVTAKTFQHTWEHGNAILRIALFAPHPGTDGDPP